MRDYYRWAMETAAALRRADFAGVDPNAVAEELEDLGRAEQRELRNRLKQLMLHLLKWRHQPTRRSLSWRASGNEQRKEIEQLLKDNPSLRTQVDDLMSQAYPLSIDAAVRQTRLPYSTFPPHCPFSLDDLMCKDLDEF